MQEFLKYICYHLRSQTSSDLDLEEVTERG